MVIEDILGIRKFQKNPAKAHGRSNNSYKMGKLFFIGKLQRKEKEKKKEPETHEPETGWNISLALDLLD